MFGFPKCDVTEPSSQSAVEEQAAKWDDGRYAGFLAALQDGDWIVKFRRSKGHVMTGYEALRNGVVVARVVTSVLMS